jgi:hypothetical protein
MRYGKEVKSYTKPFAEAYAKALGNTVNVQLIASANMIADFLVYCLGECGQASIKFNQRSEWKLG